MTIYLSTSQSNACCTQSNRETTVFAPRLNKCFWFHSCYCLVAIQKYLGVGCTENTQRTHNLAVSETMPRNTFEECLCCLYFSNKKQLDPENRYAKMRPLFGYLNKKWLLYFPRKNYLSVDESMGSYFERNGLKQHIHGKPIRFGYKIWCLCTSCGYLVQADRYQGDSTCNSNPDLGMGGSIVADLIAEL